jgi:hypothetical protein
VGFSLVTTVMLPPFSSTPIVQVMEGRAVSVRIPARNEDTPCTTSGRPVTRECSAFYIDENFKATC